jgi:hypothetical protein
MQGGRKLAFAMLVPAALLSTPAQAQLQSPEASMAQELSSCAGAVAAFAELDVLSYPDGATGEWAPVLGAILEALNRERGVEGMTGRYAASAARSHWAEQPRAELEAEAHECRAGFGGE